MQNLHELLKIAIQYPYLEMDRYTKNWKPGMEETDEAHMRYHLYVIMTHNVMSDMYHGSREHSKHLLDRADDAMEAAFFKDTTGINTIEALRSVTERSFGERIGYGEIYDTHEAWWHAQPEDSMDGWSQEYKEFVEGYYERKKNG